MGGNVEGLGGEAETGSGRGERRDGAGEHLRYERLVVVFFTPCSYLSTLFCCLFRQQDGWPIKVHRGTGEGEGRGAGREHDDPARHTRLGASCPRRHTSMGNRRDR